MASEIGVPLDSAPMGTAKRSALDTTRIRDVWRSKAPEDRLCLSLLGLAIGAYIATFCVTTFRLYGRYAMLDFDFGIFDQACWLISRGLPPFITVRGTHLLADHFSIILYLLAPFYWIWNDARVLLVAQTIALSVGAVPVYGIVRLRLLPASIALFFAVVYLFYPPMQWSNVDEFHPDTFATPLLLGAFYFLLRKNWKGYFLLLTLAALTKETAGIAVIGVGIFALTENRRIGMLTITLGAICAFLAMATVRAYNHGAPSPYLSLYNRFGNGPVEIVTHLTLHPIATLRALSTDENMFYLGALLLPLGFIPLLEPEVVLLASPILLLNLLSSRRIMHDIHYQYTAFITPFIVLAAIKGFHRYWIGGRKRTRIALLVCPAVCLVISMRDSPLAPEKFGPMLGEVSAARAREFQQMTDTIPVEATLSATANMVPHLTHRRQIYSFPNPFYKAGWGSTVQALHQENEEDFPPWTAQSLSKEMTASSVDYVLLQTMPSSFMPSDSYHEFVLAMVDSPAYGVVKIGPDIMLLRRGSDHTQGLRLLEERIGKRIHNAMELASAVKIWRND